MRFTTGKVAIALALLCTPLFAVAGGEAHPYAGLEVGNAWGDVALYDVLGSRHHFSNSGTTGGAFVGLGTLLARHFWLALEVNGDFSSERTANQAIATANGTSSAKLRIRYTYGASFVPGIWISRVMVFGRVGALQSRFSLKQSSPPAGSSGTSNENLAGGAIYGGGLQLRLTDLLHARVEYDRIIYRHFSSFNNRISLVDQEVKVGVLLDLS